LAPAPASAALTFPQLTGRVVDDAHVLPADVQAQLTQKLADLEARTSRQLVVVTLPSLQGDEISDYGYQLGRAWKIGQKGTNNGALFIGPIRGPLMRQPGAGYTTLSWDPTDNLWTTTGANAQIYLFRTGASPNTRQAKPISVTVTPSGSIPAGGGLTALQIAPDGVRVAMIIDSDDLAFGAIVWEQGTGPGLGSVKIQLSPFSVTNFTSVFTAATWYGPDNVITLGGPGSTLSEYPVSGGTPTSQMLDQHVGSITASGPGGALIAGIDNDQMIEATSLTGAWTSIVTGPAGAQTPVRGRTGRGGRQRVQDRPVGDRVGAVRHRLGLPVRGGDRPGVEVVAADDDRGGDLAGGDQVVEPATGDIPLAVAEPADPGGQTLERDP